VIIKWAMVILLTLCSAFVQASENLRQFVSGSYTQILKEKQSKPFALVLWSLECVPCHKELAMLGRFIHERSEFELVLVSVDDAATSREINKWLEKYKLQGVDSWVFSSVSAERLRYEVDHSWYGALPRSYLFNVNHRRQTYAGTMSRTTLQAWYLTVKMPAAERQVK